MVAYVSRHRDRDDVTETASLVRSQPPQGEERPCSYELQKFRRTNAGTCFNQKPIVRWGRRSRRAMCWPTARHLASGELALGKNLLVAFMPWSGYNFEDAILVSERVVRDDVFTSIHIQEFEVGARDTKLGPEEITRDIPNVGEDALRNLGPDGVSASAPRSARAISSSARSPQERDRARARGAPAARHLRREGRRRARHLAHGPQRNLRHRDGREGHSQQDTRRAGRTPMRRRAASEATLRTDSRAHEAGEIKPPRRTPRRPSARRQGGLEEQLTTALSNMLLGEKIPLDVHRRARAATSSSPPTARSPRPFSPAWRRPTTTIQIEQQPRPAEDRRDHRCEFKPQASSSSTSRPTAPSTYPDSEFSEKAAS
jgi:DNA-directed RNA polymerase subunit beta